VLSDLPGHRNPDSISARRLAAGADTVVTAAELDRDAKEFLRFKRAMGIHYQRGEFVLNSFLRLVAQHWGKHGKVTLGASMSL
jgi:hypothetical protein